MANNSLWDRLASVNLDDKERYQPIFADIVNAVQGRTFPLRVGETKKDNYTIVIEDNRMNSWFVHVVPKQVYPLFKEMQRLAPDDALGFSVLTGTSEGKDIRVSCFGVPCNLLGKALIESEKKKAKFIK